MHPFSTPWKHQKTVRFSDVFRGQRKGALGTNGLRKYLEEIASLLCAIDKIVNEWFFDWCVSDLFSVNPDSSVIMNDFYDFWMTSVAVSGGFFLYKSAVRFVFIICFNVL